MSRDPNDSKVPHVSVSQAKNCLAKTGFEKVAGLREPPSAAMAFGSTVHALIEGQYQGVPLDDIEIKEKVNKRELARAKKLAAVYEELIGANLQPRVQALEHRFLNNDICARPVLGYIDMIFTTDKDVVPVDYKTMGTPRTAVTEDEKFQLGTYGIELGLKPPFKGEVHALITKGNPEAYVLEATIGEDTIKKIKRRFAKLCKAYETGIFPAEPNRWCSRCMHFDYCGSGEVFDGDINKFIEERKNPKPKKQEKEKPVSNEIVFEKASAIRPYLKVALVGEFGTLKTRTLLAFPNPVVIDTEGGTDHYGDEFDFQRLVTMDPTKVAAAINKIGKDPGEFKTFGVDSWSVYCEAVTARFVKIFLAKETTSKGHKGEYYRLQPRDYQPINHAIMQQVKALMNLRCHVVVTMQVKDEYTGMEKTGITFDGYKRSPYYFDTVIFIKKRRDPKTGGEKLVGVVEKDRTGCLPSRIEEFGIDALKEVWADYFARDAEETPQLLEDNETMNELAETDPTPAPKPTKTATDKKKDAAKKKKEAAAKKKADAAAKKKAEKEAEKKAAEEAKARVEAPEEPEVEEPEVEAEEPKNVPNDVHKHVIARFTELGASEVTAREWIDKQTDRGVTPEGLKTSADAFELRHIQMKALVDLMLALGVPKEAWQSILKKRGAKKITDLDDDQVLEILGKLEEKANVDQLARHTDRWPFRQAV